MAGKLLKNSSLYVLLGFLSPALNFLLLPIYTRTLSKTDFSILALSMILQVFFQNLIGGGLSGAYVRYYFEYKEKNEVASLLMTTVFTSVMGLLLWMGILWFSGDFLLSLIFSNDEFTFSKYGWISLVTAVLLNVNQVLLTKYRNEENALVYAAIAVAGFLLSSAFVYVGVVVLKGGALYSLLGRMVGLSITILTFLSVFVIRNKFSIRLGFVRDMFGYSRDIMFYLMLTFLFQNIDKYLVERKFDFEYLGMYGFGINLISVVDIFVASMNNAMKPRIYKIWKEGQSHENEMKVRLIFRLMMIFLSVVWFALLLLFPVTNKFLFNNLYGELYTLLPVMAIAMIGRIYYIVYAEPIFFHMYTRVLPIITLSSFIFYLIFMLLLIPFTGIWGVVFATILSGIFRLALVINYSKYKNILPATTFSFPKEHLLFALAILIAILLSIYFHYFPVESGIWMALGAIPLIGLIYYFLYFKEFRNIRDIYTKMLQ